MFFTRKNSRILLGVVLLISGVLGYFLVTKTHFDYRMETLFPKHDPQLAYYQAFRDSFKSENEYISIGIYNEAGLFQEGFLQKIHNLGERLEALPRVYEVHSLCNLSWLRVYGMGYRREIPLVHWDEPQRYAADSAFLFALPPFRHNYYSEGGKATCMYIRIEPKLAQTPQGDSLLQQIDDAIAAADFDETHLTGYLPSHTISVKKIEFELTLFSTMSSLLVLLFLFFTFRSVWGMLVPMVVVGLSGIWAAGLMAAFGVPVNAMTVLLPSIMFVVATSDVVHLLSKYLGERRAGKSSESALQLTVREVGLATLLTSVTTAIGLLSLYISDIDPLQQLGLFAGLGVLIAFALTYMVLPPLIVLFPPPEKTVLKESQLFWPRQLRRLFAFVLQRRRALAGLCVALIALAILGASMTRVHNFFGKDLKESDPHVADIQFFEENFGGVRPFSLSLETKDPKDNFGDISLLRDLASIDTFLLDEYGLNRPYSVISMLKGANSALHRGQPAYYHIPADDSALVYLQGMLLSFSDSASLRQILADSNRLAKITGSVPDWGSAEAARRNAALTAFVNEHVDTSRIEVHLAGIAEMVDRSHEVVTYNMLTGLLLALGLVGVLMGLLFKSVKMMLLSLVPNVFPLLMILGIIGYLGISLNMATAVIFTMAFGIAVDDTIHFIARLKLELNKGKSLPFAMRRTFVSTGKAIIITSLILASGFFILISSDFKGTILTGSLVSITLLLAVLADLVLLPILLLRFGK